VQFSIKNLRDELSSRFDKVENKIEAQGTRYADMFLEQGKLLAKAMERIENNAKDIGYAHRKIRGIPKNVSIIAGIIVALIAIFSFTQNKTKSEEIARVPKKIEVKSPIKK
jgi:hypothetical protein